YQHIWNAAEPGEPENASICETSGVRSGVNRAPACWAARSIAAMRVVLRDPRLRARVGATEVVVPDARSLRELVQILMARFDNLSELVNDDGTLAGGVCAFVGPVDDDRLTRDLDTPLDDVDEVTFGPLLGDSPAVA